MENKKLLNGFEVVVKACEDAGATHMFGYPITPTTEILSKWIELSEKKDNIHCLQTEDETAAGFAVCGSLLAGEKTFTATAGPGSVLMQDGLSMAEGMRLPMVIIAGQRGGPSSGTVIYSQQELTLYTHGANGEGMRIVYSPSTLEELYELTRLAFNSAWQYKFPAIVLTDGYLLKTRQSVKLDFDVKNVSIQAVISEKTQKNIRNIYTFEQELMDELLKHKKDFAEMRTEVEKYESYLVEDADEIIIAHGLVGAATKIAVDELRRQGIKIGMFRPITISPFPQEILNKILKNVKKIYFAESSLGQLKNLVKQNLDANLNLEINGLYKPAVGIEPNEIVEMVLNNK